MQHKKGQGKRIHDINQFTVLQERLLKSYIFSKPEMKTLTNVQTADWHRCSYTCWNARLKCYLKLHLPLNDLYEISDISYKTFSTRFCFNLQANAAKSWNIGTSSVVVAATIATLRFKTLIGQNYHVSLFEECSKVYDMKKQLKDQRRFP